MIVRKQTLLSVTIVGITILVPVVFLCNIFDGILGTFIIDDNLAHYEKTIKKLAKPQGDHFPVTISHDPNKVRFYHQRLEFGMGGHGVTELWMKLEPAEIEKLYSEFEEKKTPGTPNSEKGYERGFYTADDDSTSTATISWPRADLKNLDKMPRHPKDFQYFRLDQGKDMYYRGVAISKKRNVIIYYAGYSWSS